MVQLGRISKSMRLSPDTYHKLACFACSFLQEPVPKHSKPPDIPKATMVFHSCMPSSMRFYLKTTLFHLALSFSSTLQLSDSTPLTELAFLHSKFIPLHNSDALFPWSKSALWLPLSCHPWITPVACQSPPAKVWAPQRHKLFFLPETWQVLNKSLLNEWIKAGS